MAVLPDAGVLWNVMHESEALAGFVYKVKLCSRAFQISKKNFSSVTVFKNSYFKNPFIIKKERYFGF